MQVNLVRIAAAAAIALLSAGAQAAPVYSVSAPTGQYGVNTPYTASGVAGVAVGNSSQHATPVGIAAGGSYFYVTPDAGQITLFGINASTFSFLWGSPDTVNRLTYHTSLGDYSYSGADLGSMFGVSQSGDQNTSVAFTASLAGGTITSVDFTSGVIAFEFAVPQAANGVPEPATLALSLAAFGALAWTRRRKQ